MYTILVSSLWDSAAFTAKARWRLDVSDSIFVTVCTSGVISDIGYASSSSIECKYSFCNEILVLTHEYHKSEISRCVAVQCGVCGLLLAMGGVVSRQRPLEEVVCFDFRSSARLLHHQYPTLSPPHMAIEKVGITLCSAESPAASCSTTSTEAATPAVARGEGCLSTLH